MGYTYISTHGKEFTGDSSQISAESVLSPFSFVSNEEQSLYLSNAPFYITLTTMRPESSEPFTLTVISPGFYLFTKLGQKEYKQLVLNRRQHTHSTLEIEYTREGTFFQQIEARRYKFTPRSCCLLNRNIRHKEEYDSAFSTVNLSLSYPFLQSLFDDPLDQWFPGADNSWKENTEFKPFFEIELQDSARERKSFLNFTPTPAQLQNGEDAIHDIFDRISALILSPGPGSTHLFRSEICQLLSLLSDSTRYEIALVELGTETESRIFSQITELEEKSCGRISRTELSERLNYSGNYLNRIVRKYSGMNISQYGNYFSMQRAAQLLLRTDRSITEICQELDFTDRTHFYSLFREQFGLTPKEYRKSEQHQNR